jgi:hypothetical protein
VPQFLIAGDTADVTMFVTAGATADVAMPVITGATQLTSQCLLHLVPQFVIVGDTADVTMLHLVPQSVIAGNTAYVTVSLITGATNYVARLVTAGAKALVQLRWYCDQQHQSCMN